MCLNGLCRHITHNVPIGAAPVDAAVQAVWDAEEEVLIGLLMLNLITEVWKQVKNMTTYPSVLDKYAQLDTLFGSMGAMATFNLWCTLGEYQDTGRFALPAPVPDNSGYEEYVVREWNVSQ
jgi:hypothetical protein